MRSSISYTFVLCIAIVAATAAIVLWVATNLATIPSHDEFAYVGNALYYSGVHPSTTGMTFNGESYLPQWAERPPLFWWLLTSLFAFHMSPYVAIAISPLFGVLTAVINALFAFELTKDVKVTLFAGLLTAFSGFVASIGSHMLSDVMGSFFATLAVYAFYEYFFKEKRGFIFVLGLSIGLGLVARDEDLITLVLLIVMWLLFVVKGSITKRLVYLIAFGAVFGLPVLHYSLAGTLQIISNILTPVVFDGWPIVLVLGAISTFLALRGRRAKFTELGGGFFLFFLVMLPFFYDNYYLGNVEFYIAGKGILARPIAHLLMIPQTGGVGANLPEIARISSWLYSTPSLISVPVLVLVAIGMYYLFGSDRKNFAFLFLWTLVTFGYVVAGTTLEDRFLLIALSPIMILAGIGLGFVWKLNRYLGLGAAAISLYLADIIPRTAITPSNLVLFAGLTTSSHNWLLSFIPQISLSSNPVPSLGLPELLEGFLSLPVAVIAIVLLVRSSAIEQAPEIEVPTYQEEENSTPEISNETTQSRFQTTENDSQSDDRQYGDDEDDIQIIEGEKTEQVDDIPLGENRLPKSDNFKSAVRSGETTDANKNEVDEDEDVYSLFDFNNSGSDVENEQND